MTYALLPLTGDEFVDLTQNGQQVRAQLKDLASEPPKLDRQTVTAFTLQASDAGKIVTLNNAAPITLTVPSGLPERFLCTLVQLGAGTVTITGSGATVNSQNGGDTLSQYAVAGLLAVAADTFVLYGDVTAPP